MQNKTILRTYLLNPDLFSSSVVPFINYIPNDRNDAKVMLEYYHVDMCDLLAQLLVIAKLFALDELKNFEQRIHFRVNTLCFKSLTTHLCKVSNLLNISLHLLQCFYHTKYIPTTEGSISPGFSIYFKKDYDRALNILPAILFSRKDFAWETKLRKRWTASILGQIKQFPLLIPPPLQSIEQQKWQSFLQQQSLFNLRQMLCFISQQQKEHQGQVNTYLNYKQLKQQASIEHQKFILQFLNEVSRSSEPKIKRMQKDYKNLINLLYRPEIKIEEIPEVYDEQHTFVIRSWKDVQALSKDHHTYKTIYIRGENNIYDLQDEDKSNHRQWLQHQCKFLELLYSFGLTTLSWRNYEGEVLFDQNIVELRNKICEI